MNTRITLTQTLKFYRDNHKLSQDDLSALIDSLQLEPISQNLISRIEQGRGDTTTEKLKSLCCALKVSPEDMLFSQEERHDFLYRQHDIASNEATYDKVEKSSSGKSQNHEIIKMLSDLNYKLATEHTPPEDLEAIEALLRTCLSSLHRELKNDTASAPAKTA